MPEFGWRGCRRFGRLLPTGMLIISKCRSNYLWWLNYSQVKMMSIGNCYRYNWHENIHTKTQNFSVFRWTSACIKLPPQDVLNWCTNCCTIRNISQNDSWSVICHPMPGASIVVRYPAATKLGSRRAWYLCGWWAFGILYYAIIYAGLVVKRPLGYTRPRRPKSWYSESPTKGGWISRTFNNCRVVLGYEAFMVLHSQEVSVNIWLLILRS